MEHPMPEKSHENADRVSNPDATNRAADPFFWVTQAHQLDKAAMLIWHAIREAWERNRTAPPGSVIDLEQIPNANLSGVFWLNAGLALENLFKGRIIKSRPELAANGAVAGPLKTHNLIRLAKLAGYELDVITAYYLWVGTQSVVWTGRYPCSTKPAESRPATAFCESDVLVYRQVFDNLAAQLEDPRRRRIVMKRLA